MFYLTNRTLKIMLFLGGFFIHMTATQATENVSLTIQRLVEQQVKAQTQFDTVTLKKILDRHYFEVSTVGEVDSLEHVLEFYSEENKSDGPKVEVDDFNIRVFGDSGVLIARVIYTMVLPDDNVKKISLRGTWVTSKVDEKWVIVSAHFTAIRPPKQ